MKRKYEKVIKQQYWTMQKKVIVAIEKASLETYEKHDRNINNRKVTPNNLL